MSQRDGFASGFVAGALIGSIFGGVVGALVAARSNQKDDFADHDLIEASEDTVEGKAASIEAARLSLEGKIAQLNLAIDDVRQQLGAVNGNARQKEQDSTQR